MKIARKRVAGSKFRNRGDMSTAKTSKYSSNL
jgi:hypothetical protein